MLFLFGRDGVLMSPKFTLSFLVEHMPNPDGLDAAERRSRYDAWISQLKHWKE
jgi:hypothetical protein